MQHESNSVENEKELIARTLSTSSEAHISWPILLANLGMSHDLLNEPHDIQKTIEFMSLALTLLPDGDPRLAELLDALGTYHDERFQRFNEGNDVEKAIEYRSRVLSLTHDQYHMNFSRRLANLGASFKHRFRRLGCLSDIEKAIEYESSALSLTPKGHPDLSDRFANLGVSHSDRYQPLGNLDDLEKAIEYHSCALALTPTGHPYLSHRFANLGVSHRDRFQRLGELDDIAKALEYESRALELTPKSHPDISSRYANLGMSHSYRFKRLWEPNDLNKSIEYKSCSIDLTPDSHPNLPDRLTNLGVSYIYQFKRLAEPDALDKAIECMSRAVALTPHSHPKLSRQLTNLGVSYADRFRQRGNPVDLETAIEYQSRALAMTPVGHPYLPLKHQNMAKTYLLRACNTGDLSHSQSSLDFFRKSSQSLTGSPRAKFGYAFEWAKLASSYSFLNRVEAYQTTIELLPQFIWLGATTNQLYEDLLRAETLAVDAASAAILSLDYALALEWLEHARCVVWNQSLMLRLPLDRLQHSHPYLAARLQEVANQLHHAGSESRESREHAASLFVPEQVAQQHRRLAMEHSDLLSQARTLPGLEDFLKPMKAKDLMHAARNGPIVVINCHEDHCDALMIMPGQTNINHIHLPKFTAKKARYIFSELGTSLRRKGLRERGVKIRQEADYKDNFGSMLEILWDEIVKPVLDFLGYTISPSIENLPHITWCPTGALSFLPLHAAGNYNRPQSRVFNYVVSSYTPTLTALLASTPNSLCRDSRLLAIGLERTPGHNQLPGTVKELTCVQSHAQNVVQYTQLVNSQATPTYVLDEMEKNNWVHLACHAHQNVVDPTKSGFFLHGGTLDLGAINRRSFKNKGLAFLSACQTATGDEKLPDEAIHLASGMLMAGYPSVIATMWSVVDEDAPYVADKVYGQLMKGGKVGNGEAGKALHYAVAALRERVGEDEFGRWVPYIHIGS